VCALRTLESHAAVILIVIGTGIEDVHQDARRLTRLLLEVWHFKEAGLALGWLFAHGVGFIFTPTVSRMDLISSKV
jgi:hypothetical protein